MLKNVTSAPLEAKIAVLTGKDHVERMLRCNSEPWKDVAPVAKEHLFHNYSRVKHLHRKYEGMLSAGVTTWEASLKGKLSSDTCSEYGCTWRPSRSMATVSANREARAASVVVEAAGRHCVHAGFYACVSHTGLVWCFRCQYGLTSSASA